jgi:hypothetical protein
MPAFSPALAAEQTGRSRGTSVVSIHGEKPRAGVRPLTVALAGAGLLGSLTLAFAYGRSTSTTPQTPVLLAKTTVEEAPELPPAVSQAPMPSASAPPSATPALPAVESTLAIQSAAPPTTAPPRPKTTVRAPRPNPDDLGF